ncbi:MAG: sigma-70 family RNA polymerase sigma factor [Pseudomonadota bacterium]
MDRKTQDMLIALLPRVRRFAMSLTRSEADADDLTQATVERAIAKISQWRPGSRLDSWLYKIAQNLHLNEQRRHSVRRREAGAVKMAQFTVIEGGGEAASDLNRLQNRIAALPEEQRQVLLLVAVEGYGYAEAAEIVGVPIGTITSRLARARSALKEDAEQRERRANG